MLAASALLGGAVLVPLLLGALAVPMQRELGYGDRDLGAAAALFWAATAVSAPLAGRLADRLGWRTATRWGGLAAATCLLATAAWTESYGQLLVWLALGGIVYAFASPASNLALAHEVRPARHALAFGLKQSSSPVASVLAGIAVPLVALTAGWRWVYVLAALPVLLAAGAAGRTTGTAVPTAPAGRAGGSRRMAALMAAASLATLATGALTTFSVRTLTESGLSAGAAGLVLALAGGSAVLARVGAGWLVDARGLPPLRAAAVLLLAGVAGLVLLSAGSPATGIAGAMLSAAGVWGWPALLLVGVVALRPAGSGAATGLIQFGTGVGASAGPLLFGLLVEQSGFRAAWLAVAVAATAGAFVMWQSAR